MQINIEKVKEMADKHLEWLQANTKDDLPLAINSKKLVKAHFHVEEGRGGYFAPESGTSEGQFLLILGMLEMYKSTNETKWLTDAESLMEAALTTLYPSDLPTEEFNEDYIFSPHWLFNAANSFIAERYYLDKEVTVENGRGTFTCEAPARKIFSARSNESTLLWENPFAEVVGTEYEIKSYSTDGNVFTFELEDSTINDVIKIVYSDLGGPVIEPNETYEAWPVWRKLKDGEIACAIDSLWWSYSCFKLLSELTNRQHYKTILKNLKGLIKFACSISNAEDYFSIDKTTDDPFSKVGTYSYQDRTPEAVFSRHETNGSVVIDIPEGSGSVQFGQGDMNELVGKDRGLRFKYKSSNSTKLNLIASTVQGYDESCRFICALKPKVNEMQEIDLNWSDFVRIDNILFDIVYKPTNESRYTSENSQINLSTSREDSGREYRIIEFVRGMETDGVDEWLGHAQYQNFYGDLEEIPSVHYASDGKVAVRIKDADGFYWSKTLDQSTSFKKVRLTRSDFKLADYQENEGAPATITGPIREFIFEAVDKNPTLKLKEIGDFINMNDEDSIRELILEYREEEAVNLEIYYLRPIVLDKYQYAPYVAPFTVNTINHKLDDWRGTPYVGYQCPWIWAELDDQAGVNTVLKFMRESQYAYQRITQKEDWFFCQVFIWDRWDSKQYGDPNTFTWNGPDPNTNWAGFQYRAIETVAKTLYAQPLNADAQTILESFFDSLEKFWNIEEGLIPTEFNENGEVKSEYKDPHGLALIMRSATFAYLSNVIDKQRCTQIIEKSLNALIDIFDNQTNLIGTWSVKNGEWYQFHSGEILHSLALLLRIKKGDIRTELEQAKRNYDIKHEALKNTINEVISDKKFDKDTESNPLDLAFKEYNDALSNFKNVAQKAIDFISSARKDEAVEESKIYSNAQIKVVSDSITMRVEKVEVGKADADKIISIINQTAEKITISASKIDLSGYVTINNLKGNGTTTIDGSNIKTGVIQSVDGSIWLDLNQGSFIYYENGRFLGASNRIYDHWTKTYGLGMLANTDSFVTLATAMNDYATVYAPELVIVAKDVRRYDTGEIRYRKGVNFRADVHASNISAGYIEVDSLVVKTKASTFLNGARHTVPVSMKKSIEHFGNGNLENRYCRINLPIGFFHDGYIVNISPLGSGSYQIKKYDDYFEVTGDIKEFDYIIKGII